MMKQTIKTMFALLALLVSSTGAWAWEGSGESTNPYLIKTIADMEQLATDVNGGTDDYSGKYFRLENDLTYTGGANNYTPIGSAGHSFAGNFNGNGKTIKGIRYTYTEDSNVDIGLFGYVINGKVENLTLDDCWFQKTGASNGDIAVVIGYANYTEIDKVIVKNSKAIAKNGNAAGITAYAYSPVTSNGRYSSSRLFSGNRTVFNVIIIYRTASSSITTDTARMVRLDGAMKDYVIGSRRSILVGDDTACYTL